MATILQTPAIYAIAHFDPGYEQVIEFYYTDNQPYKNRLVITDNGTGKVVYDKITESMRLSSIIPQNTLSPGKQYLAQIQVFDFNNNHSNLSDPILFYCLASPRFRFSNVSNGDIHRSATISLSLDYYQPENESLKDYQFFLYSNDKVLLSSSATIYSPTPEPYSFSGLKNNTTYYIRATGETIHGVQLDTNYIEIMVSYSELPTNAVFSAENNFHGGYIQLATNVIIIGYELGNDNYMLKDGVLTLEDNYLLYHSGFKVNRDFSLFVEAKQLPIGKFLTTNDNSFSLHIVNICDEYYCKLAVKDSDAVYFSPLPKAQSVNSETTCPCKNLSSYQINTIKSSYDDDEFIVFEVKRSKGIYSIHTYYRKDHQEVTT